MEIELWSGNTKAIIDPRGAWLTNLSDEWGDILYPKRSITAPDGSVKVRGGCHVCVPNFGPGGDSGLPQHGFGRVMDWEITDKTASSALLTLMRGDVGYEELSSVVTYHLEGQSLVVALEVTNDGMTDLRVAPAFHPYFSTVHDPESVTIDGEKRSLDEFVETEFATTASRTLETAQRKITLQSDTLSKWATWTDNVAPYLCIEPTLSGYAFLQKVPATDEIVRPGQTRTFEATISWQDTV